MSSRRGEVLHMVREWERQGLRVRQTRNSHFQVFASDGRLLTTIGGTPGSKRSVRNAMNQVRRGTG